MRGTYSEKPIPQGAVDSTVGHVIPVHWLTRSQNKVWLEHHGELYQLQITRNGKLILTK